VSKEMAQFRITIPLKNSQSLRSKADGDLLLDEEFIRVIEYEYAVRFLEK
jgi:hypothetical protein